MLREDTLPLEKSVDADPNQAKSSWWLWVGLALAGLVAAAGLGYGLWRRRQRGKGPQEQATAPPVFRPQVQGLSEAEAESRRMEGLDNEIALAPHLTTAEIVRTSALNIFNFNLIGIAIVLVLIGQYLDAAISIGVACLNTSLNIAQQLLAKRNLEKLQLATRPKATVIRQGTARSIDANQIVRGDALVVGPGDAFVADGQLLGDRQIVADESLLAGTTQHVSKGPGDKVYAGSFCLSGRAAYEAQELGAERQIAKIAAQTKSKKEELTPLQRIVATVLYALMAVVLVFTVLLLFSYVNQDAEILVEQYQSAASVIFSIAPGGLFFMVVVGYAMGTLRMAKIGALIHRSRSVEALAQVKALCFSKAGALTGTRVELEPIDQATQQETLDNNRIRRILGDFARSSTVDNQTNQAIADVLDGDFRTVLEEAPFLSLYGWSAISFDHEDLRGVYVLGNPEVLRSHIVTLESAGEEDDESAQPGRVRGLFNSARHLFGRGNKSNEGGSQESSGTTAAVSELNSAIPEGQDAGPKEESPKPNVVKRLFGRVGKILNKAEANGEQEEEVEAEEEIVREPDFVFAYRPDLCPLHDPAGQPQLPEGLIPLTALRLSEEVRSDAKETIEGFSAQGVDIKVLTSDSATKVAKLMVRAGMKAKEEESIGLISGLELANLNPEELRQAALTNTIFGDLTPEQKGGVVGALRRRGQPVAMVGEGINDIPSLRQADLAITMQSSSQAALSLADIVLLKNDLSVMLEILREGQRIVSGLLNTLKLYLTQVGYLIALIVIFIAALDGFPYKAVQGSFIAVFTLSLPVVGLSFWAPTGRISRSEMTRSLARFVIPAAATVTVAALLVHLMFLYQTGDMEYTQLALTNLLVVTGLILVVFVLPPWRKMGDGSTRKGDWRPLAMSIGIYVLTLAVVAIPLARKSFGIDWLRQMSDYVQIWGIALGWAISVQIVWWLLSLRKNVGRKADAADELPASG